MTVGEATLLFVIGPWVLAVLIAITITSIKEKRNKHEEQTNELLQNMQQFEGAE